MGRGKIVRNNFSKKLKNREELSSSCLIVAWKFFVTLTKLPLVFFHLISFYPCQTFLDLNLWNFPIHQSWSCTLEYYNSCSGVAVDVSGWRETRKVLSSVIATKVFQVWRSLPCLIFEDMWTTSQLTWLPFLYTRLWSLTDPLIFPDTAIPFNIVT